MEKNEEFQINASAAQTVDSQLLSALRFQNARPHPPAGMLVANRDSTLLASR
jgi:hypothetical protein